MTTREMVIQLVTSEPELTLAAVAERCGVTRQRVQQLRSALGLGAMPTVVSRVCHVCGELFQGRRKSRYCRDCSLEFFTCIECGAVGPRHNKPFGLCRPCELATRGERHLDQLSPASAAVHALRRPGDYAILECHHTPSGQCQTALNAWRHAKSRGMKISTWHSPRQGDVPRRVVIQERFPKEILMTHVNEAECQQCGAVEGEGTLIRGGICGTCADRERSEEQAQDAAGEWDANQRREE